jgi:hypothetical protein
MLSSRDFDTIARKLEMEIRDGDHRFALLRHEGRVVIRTKRSQGSEIATGTPDTKSTQGR